MEKLKNGFFLAEGEYLTDLRTFLVKLENIFDDKGTLIHVKTQKSRSFSDICNSFCPELATFNTFHLFKQPPLVFEIMN